MPVIFCQELGEIKLSSADFVASGGEADIYTRGEHAFKIYKNHCIPLGKLQELQKITIPQVIKPQRLLVDKHGNNIGYRMQFLPTAISLAPLLTRSYQQRNNISTQQLLTLIQQLCEGLHQLHQQNIFVVDLHALNFLVDPLYKQLFFIDVDSYQTPHYPATAILDSIRDRNAPVGVFHAQTDWFAFALLSFQLLIGIHPFKGRHPTIHGLDNRMKASISVLHPEVACPPSCFSFDRIPPLLRDWYHRVFEHGERCAPPTWQNNSYKMTAQPPKTSSATLQIKRLFQSSSTTEPILLHAHRLAKRILLTQHHLYDDNNYQQHHCNTPKAVLFSPRTLTPVIVSHQPNHPPTLYMNKSLQTIPFTVPFQQLSSAHGRIYGKCGGEIIELVLHEPGQKILATAKRLASCLRYATQLYSGVFVQNMMGNYHLTLLDESGASFQVQLPELNNQRIVNARYTRGVLMLQISKQGSLHRWVYRFHQNRRTYDLKKYEDESGLNFVVLDSGVVLFLTNDGSLQLFLAAPNQDATRRIEACGLRGQELLCSEGGQAFCVDGDSFYSLRLQDAS